jgi:hypothetical protein
MPKSGPWRALDASHWQSAFYTRLRSLRLPGFFGGSVRHSDSKHKKNHFRILKMLILNKIRYLRDSVKFSDRRNGTWDSNLFLDVPFSPVGSDKRLTGESFFAEHEELL